MKLFLISLTVVLFLGCSSIKPPVTEYRIVTDNKVTKSVSSACKDKSLKVAKAFSSSSLMSMKMNYMLTNNQTFSYSQAQWSDTPNRAVSLEILRQIRASGLFKYIQSSKTRSKSDLILETYIEDFTQYYNDELSQSYANVVISFSLIDLKTNDVIASKLFKSRATTDTLDALGGSKALNKALGDVLYKNIKWLGEVCK